MMAYSFVVVQGSANPRTPGLVNFVIAVAYHFCLNLPRAFSQPGGRGLADPCMGVDCSYIQRRLRDHAFRAPLKAIVHLDVQGSANPRPPGCENALGKFRQKW